MAWSSKQGLHKSAAVLLAVFFGMAAFMPCAYAQSGLQTDYARQAYCAHEAPGIAADLLQRVIVLEAKSGQVLLEKEADAAFSPSGSAVTLMTAYIALNELDAAERVIVSQEHLAGEDFGVSLGLSAGDEVTVRDLLAGMILSGAQDCAVVLAKHIAGSTELFVQRMNETAQSLQMASTVYVNATGIYDEAQKTTARDLMRLVHAVSNMDADAKTVFETAQYAVEAEDSHLPERIDNRVALMLPDLEEYDGRVTLGFGGGSSQAEGFNTAIGAKTEDLDLLIVASSVRSERRVYAALTELIDAVDAEYTAVDVSAPVKSAVEGVVPDVEGCTLEWTSPEVYLAGTSDWSVNPESLTCEWNQTAQEAVAGEAYAKVTVRYAGDAVGEVSVICTQVKEPEPEAAEPPVQEEAPQETPAQEPEVDFDTTIPEDYTPYERTAYDKYGWLYWSLAALIGGAALAGVCEWIARRFN